MELGKARLSAMVVLTTALGYAVAAKATLNFDWRVLGWTCLGTFLAAVGASAFNQAWEMLRDAKMERTKRRPVPTEEISRAHAAFVGAIASIAGITILYPTSNRLTAILGIVNILLYVLVYTPLKPVSTVNTLVGAVVGGIPPMMGWAAATGSPSAGAWVLGSILFVWQIPHFLALTWMYRYEYAKAGFKMVSTVELTGRLTALLTLLYSIVLIPTAAAMSMTGHAGWPFALVAALLGTGLTCLALRFTATRAYADARRLFLATIVYLPLLSGALVLDARGPYDWMLRGEAGYSSPPAAGETFVDPSTIPQR
ncbi:MAG: heme o synthase [Phycisphaerales bacterium]|nr:heme o synthase [Phycisphaerales bacterium]